MGERFVVNPKRCIHRLSAPPAPLKSPPPSPAQDRPKMGNGRKSKGRKHTKGKSKKPKPAPAEEEPAAIVPAATQYVDPPGEFDPMELLRFGQRFGKGDPHDLKFALDMFKDASARKKILLEARRRCDAVGEHYPDHVLKDRAAPASLRPTGARCHPPKERRASL